jgi:1-acyl-sn-glycerol-3-phosphate acyltransferase
LFYWVLKWVLIGPLIKMIFRPTAEGAENVPEEGGAILASNHLSYSDWLFMPLVIPRRVTFVAKAEYFTTPGIKGWLQKTFFSGAGQVPIDRSSGSAAAGAIATGLKILAAGDLFGIYPEGTRSPDGKLYRGRTGVARMALDAKVPVVPVAVIDSDVVAPPGKIFGTYARPRVVFGKALDFSRYEGMQDDRYVLRSITDEIMYEIMTLSGQEYVDIYATRAKELAQRAAKEAAAAAKAEAKEAKAEAKAAEAEAKAAQAEEEARAEERAEAEADAETDAGADATPETRPEVTPDTGPDARASDTPEDKSA